jgi:hypothetical protein
LVGWLVGDQLLLKDFMSYGIIFMNVRFVITVAMEMLLKRFWALWDNIYDSVCLLDISRHA